MQYEILKLSSFNLHFKDHFLFRIATVGQYRRIVDALLSAYDQRHSVALVIGNQLFAVHQNRTKPDEYIQIFKSMALGTTSIRVFSVN